MKLKKLNTTTQILMATLLAIVLGTLIGPAMAKVEFIGLIWIRLIQMSIILLLMTSVAGAIGNIEGAGAGKLSLLTFKYIIGFTVISALIGLGLGLLLKPGLGVDLGVAGGASGATQLANTSLTDTLLNFVPSNIIGAMAEGSTVQAIVYSLIF